MAGTFKDLVAWQLSMTLCQKVYELTSRFPPEEKYGLTSQLRRSAVSVPSNIAEGAASSSTKELTNYLHIARGSLSELQTQFLISQSLGLISDSTTLEQEIDRVHAVLNGLIRKSKR